mmetsp:Transcript_92988/g.272155  ORF Transcript_92988/g.272155 Transcript_92988/m.272155 type:complete len:205 (+) Transcript_92988:370-984(+)
MLQQRRRDVHDVGAPQASRCRCASRQLRVAPGKGAQHRAAQEGDGRSHCRPLDGALAGDVLHDARHNWRLWYLVVHVEQDSEELNVQTSHSRVCILQALHRELKYLLHGRLWGHNLDAARSHVLAQVHQHGKARHHAEITLLGHTALSVLAGATLLSRLLPLEQMQKHCRPGCFAHLAGVHYDGQQRDGATSPLPLCRGALLRQ